tara:strand:+ start:114 stop:974 length:861 start_codon:yes stop_codon:yes gene_type:complete
MWDFVEPINRHNILIINDDICPMDSKDIYHFFDTNSIAELYDIEFYKHPECEYNVDEDKYYPTGYAIIYIDYWYDTNNSSSFYNSLINYYNIKKDKVFIFRTSGNGPPWNIELYYNGYFNSDINNQNMNKKQKTYSQTSTSTQSYDNYNDLSKKRKREENDYLDKDNHQLDNYEEHNHEQHNHQQDNYYQLSDEEEDEEEEEEEEEYEEEEEEEEEEEQQNNDEYFNIYNFIKLKNNYKIIHKKYYNLLAVNNYLVKRNKELAKSCKKHKHLNKKNVWCRRLRHFN